MSGSHTVKRLLRDDRGATAIEYGLIVALIALGALVAFEGLGTGSNGLWGDVADQATQAMS
ncbi:MAG TPA: Flp family type IVb pilin [Croceibacterium sp.]|nr:Flp family type IVb pilin [Croceibacterium sp.]